MKRQKVLNNSKAAWAAKLFVFPVFLLSSVSIALSPSSVSAAEFSDQKMVYEVYAGGIHAVQSTVDIQTTPSKYDLFISAKTRGLLGKLAPWAGTFESRGKIKGEQYIPSQHKSVGEWRGEVEVKDYSYDANGKFTKITIDEHDKKPYVPDIEKEITDGTTDALTAALAVFENYSKNSKCEGSSKVFDGKRSFEQIFKHKKTTDLQASKYNIYEGKAAECTVEVVPLKGKWYDKPRGWLSIQEQGRERGTMPTVWLASLEEGAPAVPVKIRVKTAYGTLFMHLAEYQNKGKTIVAEKRVLDDEEDAE